MCIMTRDAVIKYIREFYSFEQKFLHSCQGDNETFVLNVNVEKLRAI